MKSRNWILFSLYCLWFAGYTDFAGARESSGYRYAASLPVVDEAGFYAIDLPWQVIGGAQSDLSDVRIWDNNRKEIAYLIRQDRSAFSKTDFKTYPAEITYLPARTDVLIETGGKKISSFVLRIGNADVKKEVSIRGSNDRQRWYAVKDKFRLEYAPEAGETVAGLTVDFPLSGYSYYLLSINDSLSAPLNIMAVGETNRVQYVKRNQWEVPPSAITVSNREKYTDITLSFPYKYYFSELVFYISSPAFYNREVSFIRTRKIQNAPRKKLLRKYQAYEENVQQAYAGGSLSSDGNDFSVIKCNQYADTLRMRIQNGDDQPLHIDSIKTYIDRFYLVAYLEAGTAYTLQYGNEQAAAPEYDLSFETHIPDEIQHLALADVRPLPIASVPESHPWLPFLKTYGIWAIILLVILQILYLVRKTLKQ